MKIEFIVFISLIAIIPLGLAILHRRHAFLVPEGYVGLLYHEGKFAETLTAGRHIRWGPHYTLDAQDVRKAALQIAGQEVLTADSVSLKLSLHVSYQVTDPLKAAHETQGWQADLYSAGQLALRAVIGTVSVETMLQQRPDFSAQLLARIQPEAAKVGITVHAAEIKDLVFPADLKRVFADVLKAKQEGQATLERARGESAALRNLANAARVLDASPALQNLRLMQALTAAQRGGNTLMVGLPGGFVPPKPGPLSAPAPEPPAEG